MHPCDCRDCFEITAGEAGSMCWECREAGCEPDSECCREGAYGSDEVCAEHLSFGCKVCPSEE